MSTKNALFKIESISANTGQCEVRFINKYGPIHTGEKTIEDFKQYIEVPTGTIKDDGTPVTETKVIFLTDNPNEDFVWNIDIPIANGVFITGDDLLEHIANHYPYDIFDQMNARKNAQNKQDLLQLANGVYSIDIVTTAPGVVIEDPWVSLRRQRNLLLTATDWTQVDDAVPPGGKQVWATYRQALRDLPANTIDPENPVWPIPPADLDII